MASQGDSQSSDWGITECFKRAGVDEKDEDMKDAGSKRKTRTSKPNLEKVPEKKGKPDPVAEKVNEDLKKLHEFELRWAEDSKKRNHEFTVIALQGKTKTGGIFVPEGCMFAINVNDPEQSRKVKIVLTEKAREWTAKCPDVVEPFYIIQANGFANQKITAIGGIDYGLKSIPIVKSQAGVKKRSRKD